MSPPNGDPKGSVGTDHSGKSAPPAMASTPLFNPDQVKQFVALLEVPFDPAVIEWRVTNTSKGKVNGSLRGQVIPYADQRAYTDRLNALFSPAGWTRKYSVHTSANFQHSKDQQITAKVCVTCDVTIFGKSHSGEAVFIHRVALANLYMNNSNRSSIVCRSAGGQIPSCAWPFQ